MRTLIGVTNLSCAHAKSMVSQVSVLAPELDNQKSSRIATVLSEFGAK